MTITLNGTTGIVNDGGYTGDGVVFPDNTPANTLVTTTGGNVGVGTASPSEKLNISSSSGITRLKIDSTGSVASSIRFTTTNDSQGYINYDTGDFKFFNNSGGSAVERMRIDSSGNLLFNSGYGSVATAYGCRAWVNFNGQGTVAIRASGNVSSVSDLGTGDYIINYTTAFPDANYSAVSGIWHRAGVNPTGSIAFEVPYSTTQTGMYVRDYQGTPFDPLIVSLAIFR
jgi:hypothetical protein